MKIKHKLLSIILSIIILVSVVQVTASAFSGTCGDNAKWTYDDKTCTLTISGTGDMYDYKYNNRPWENYEDEIKYVVIENGITSICAYAFYSCNNLLEATIPDSVTKIGKTAFQSCESLNEITIPGSVTTIGTYGFRKCEKLTSIIFEDGIETIGISAFEDCYNLTSITIPDSVTTIGTGAFYNCYNIEKVIIGDGVTTIGSGAFNLNPELFFDDSMYFIDSMNITELKIGNNVKTIGSTAFAQCKKLKNVIIPDSVETIGRMAFRDCSNLTNLVIGKGVKTIVERAFEGCSSLTNVVITENVETIEARAFFLCTDITSVFIGNGIKIIDYAAFGGCNNLKDVYYEGTEEEWKLIEIDKTDYISSQWNNDYLLNATIHYNHKHSYTNPVITPATCTEEGYTTSTCVCGAVSVGDYVEAGHSPEEAIEENIVLPTCTEDGTKDVVVYCSVCKEEVSRETVAIEATGHDYSIPTYVAPPCNQKGYTIYECHCGASALRDFVDITGHIDSDNDGCCDQCNKSLETSTKASSEEASTGLISIFNIILKLFEMLFSAFNFMKV